MEKVVKCTNSKCGQYFMREGKNIKYCPFCHTEYVEVDPVRSREGSSRTKQDAEHVRSFVRDSQRAPLEIPAQARAGIKDSLSLTGRASASNGVEEKTASSAEASDFAKASTDKSAAKKDKKGTTKTRKESFKIWKNN